MVTKSIESPLAEMTLRKYERPYKLSKRELVAKLCLSLGVLQPGDSRDVIIDVLYVLLEARQTRTLLSSIEVRNAVVDVRRACNIRLLGIADSNIRRQLLRLRDIAIVEKIKNDYRIAEHETMQQIFNEHIKAFYLASILQRIEEYTQAIDKEFPYTS
ncbi:MAG: hypothetical protein ACMXYC_01795 [Candidatus Woesearchaeota archaeon]